LPAASPAQVDGLSEGIDKIGIVFPDQGGNGTHVNISGAGLDCACAQPRQRGEAAWNI
jgi:hypothetical protein